MGNYDRIKRLASEVDQIASRGEVSKYVIPPGGESVLQRIAHKYGDALNDAGTKFPGLGKLGARVIHDKKAVLALASESQDPQTKAQLKRLADHLAKAEREIHFFDLVDVLADQIPNVEMADYLARTILGKS